MDKPPHDALHAEPSADDAIRYSDGDRWAIEKHYERFFGESYFRVLHEKRSVATHIDIYTYGASATRPYVTLATAGMGAVESASYCTEHAHSTELVTYVPHDWDFSTPEAIWLTRRLIEVARYPCEDQKVVAKHHTWCVYDEKTNVAVALIPGSLFTHWYFRALIHEPKEIDHLVLPSGRHVNFMWAYPITRHEHYFRDQSEPSELDVQLATYAETPISLNRPCLVSTENRQERRVRDKQRKRLARTSPVVPWMALPCDYHQNRDDSPEAWRNV